MTVQHHPAPVSVTLIVFPRDVVERNDVAQALATLRPLAASPGQARAHRGAVEFVFEGFDDDARELHRIPAVRRFVQELDRQWPYWLYYGAKTGDTLAVIMLCLLDGHVARREPGRVGYAIDGEQLRAMLLRLFAGSNDLYDRLGLDEDDNARLTEEVIGYVTSCLV